MSDLSIATNALTERRPADALEPLDRLLAQNPADVTALYLRGVSYLHLGELDGAELDLRRAVALDPTDEAGQVLLARVLHQQGETTLALEHFEVFLQDSEGSGWSYASFGHLCLDAGRWKDAYSAFKTAVEKDPEESSAHRGLAIIFSEAGQPERAAQAYRQILSLDPDSVFAHVGLGHAQRDLGKLTEALSSYRRARELEPQRAVHAGNEASTLVEMGRLTEGRFVYEDALALESQEGPDRAVLHLGLAMVLEELGEVESAREEYQYALDQDFTLFIAHEAMGLMAAASGHSEKAVEHLKLALDLGGLSPLAAVRLSLLLEEMGDQEGAREIALLMERWEATDPELAFRRAELLVHSADPQIRDSDKAVDLLLPLVGDSLSDQGPVWDLLGEAFAERGEFSRAVEAMDQALSRVDPGDPGWFRYKNQRAAYMDLLNDK
ncbi:MAG: tetratricopeptide repeat protein [Planctomycetota bacterium]|nr:tetratricopeptide repeat protein [Planctomycetota bacterium]